jgi:uncharacterized protein (TIGR02099 family)
MPSALRLSALLLRSAGLLRAASRIAALGTAGVLIIGCAAWLIMQWGILPRLDLWRPALESWATRSLGLPVRIGRLEADGDLWAPVLTLHDLRLIDAQQHEALRLARVDAVLTPGSLLPRSLTQWTPHLKLLSIDALHLELRRDASGRIFLAGLPLDRAPGTPTGTEDDGSPLADWLFSQAEIRLRGASVTWHDARRDVEPLMLSGVDLDLVNPFGRHTALLRATPPVGWGERFSVSAEFGAPLLSLARLRHPGDWRQWSGEIRADWPHVDVSRLRRHVGLPFDLLEGRGRLATQVTVRDGQPSGATADLQLEAVTLRLAEALPPLALRRIAGQLQVQHDAQGSRLQARGLTFQLPPPADAARAADPALWPATDLTLTLDGQPGAWQGGRVSASLIDLGLLARSAAHVPLSRPMRRLLDETRPGGRVRALQYDWQGDPDNPRHWQARGTASDLSLTAEPATAALTTTATPGRPGLSGADVRFEAGDLGGRADLRMPHGGTLDFPGVFEEPRVPLDQLQAEVRWTLQHRADAAPGSRPAITVHVPRAVFATPDSRGEFSGRWRTGPETGPAFGPDGWLPGHIDLSAAVAHIRAERVHRYLPLGIAASVRHYVRDAVRQGTARDVHARVRGRVLDFPFVGSGQGEFRIAGRAEGVTFDAVPGSRWPRYTDIDGGLIVDRTRLQIRQASGRLGQTGSGQFALEGVDGGIDDFLQDPVLRLSGRGHGDVADVLQFLTDSPVDGWLGQPFAPARGRGAARLQLDLAIPVLQPHDTRVKGHVDLAEARLRMRPDTPELTALQAGLDFTERTFVLPHGRARVAGGELQFQGRLDDDGVVRFTGTGRATTAGLRELDELGPVPWIAAQFDGQADYRLALDLSGAGAVVAVDSDLVGVSSRLPAPLDKRAAAALPLRVRLRPQPAAATPAASAPELLDIEAGPPEQPLLAVRYLRDGQDATRVLAGRLELGRVEPAPPAAGSGVNAAITLPRLAADPWHAWLQQLRAASASPLPTIDTDRAATTAPALPLDNPYVPRQIRVQLGELSARGHRLQQVDARITVPASLDGVWHAGVQSTQLAGQVEIDPAAARVQARLERLIVTRDPLAPEADPATAHPPVHPAAADDTRLPTLDITIDHFVFAGRPLGRLELEASPQRPDPGAPGTAPVLPWRLTRLALLRPEAQLHAVGLWTPPRPGWVDPAGGAGIPGATRLTFRLDVHDGGELLDRLGWPGTLRGGHGQLGGQLQWPGAPLDFATARLGGQLRIAIEDGQFLQADPGVARLLGVLSLQSLPRRFLLDFRDVFQQGFGFDHIDGDVLIRQGLASTRNLRIRGLPAMVLTEGTASMADETQDLHVWVVPDLNAGAASLAYAVINPALGLGTLLTQLFLQRPLAEAATREFRITGGWDDPQVHTVDRRTRSRPRPDDDTATPTAPMPSAATSPP